MLTPPTATSSTFNYINSTCKLYIPKTATKAYRNSIGWTNFTDIIEKETTSIYKTQENNVKIHTNQRAIVVTGADLRDEISVYAESGILLQSTKVTDNIVRINATTNHIYLIKTTGKIFKVAL